MNKRVYVAGQLSRKGFDIEDRTSPQIVVDYIKNVHKMCRVAYELIQHGFAPFVPALDFLIGIVSGEMEENHYRNPSIAFLEVCDAVLVISLSPGVLAEIEMAKQLNIPIFYSIGELIHAFGPSGSGLGGSAKD